MLDLHRFWTVKEPEGKVFAFLRDHAPTGGKLSSWNGGGRTYELRYTVSPNATGSRLLVLTVTALRGGGAGVRADAQVQEIIPRPKSARIPSAVRVLEVTAGRPGMKPLVTRTVTDRSRVRRIAEMIDRLHTVQPGVTVCPNMTRSTLVTFTFRARRGGRVLARAREPGSADCGNSMTLVIKGHQTSLSGGPAVVRRVQRMLGIRLMRKN